MRSNLTLEEHDCRLLARERRAAGGAQRAMQLAHDRGDHAEHPRPRCPACPGTRWLQREGRHADWQLEAPAGYRFSTERLHVMVFAGSTKKEAIREAALRGTALERCPQDCDCRELAGAYCPACGRPLVDHAACEGGAR